MLYRYDYIFPVGSFFTVTFENTVLLFIDVAKSNNLGVYKNLVRALKYSTLQIDDKILILKRNKFSLTFVAVYELKKYLQSP